MTVSFVAEVAEALGSGFANGATTGGTGGVACTGSTLAESFVARRAAAFFTGGFVDVAVGDVSVGDVSVAAMSLVLRLVAVARFFGGVALIALSRDAGNGKSPVRASVVKSSGLLAPASCGGLVGLAMGQV